MNLSPSIRFLYSALFIFAAGFVQAQTPIGSAADWIAVGATASDDLVLTDDISFSTMPQTIDLGSFDFDGGGHTLRLPSGTFPGLFALKGGTIHDLNLDLGTAVLAEGAGGMVTGSTDPSDNFGKLFNCSVQGDNPITNNECGGLTGRNFGSPDSLIDRSVSSLDIEDARDAGGIAGSNFLGTIRNSQMLGTLQSTSSTSGGILAGGLVASNGVVVEACVMSGDVLGVSSGGIVGDGSDVRISKSIMAGSVTGSNDNGSFVGIWNGYSDLSTVLIDSSYTSVASAPMVGSLDYVFFSVTIEIRNSYLASIAQAIVGKLEGSGIAGGGTLTVNGVYGGSSPSAVERPDWTVQAGASGYSSNFEALNGTIGQGWDAQLWASIDGSLPVLSAFRKGLWVGYHNDYLGSPYLPPELDIAVGGGEVTLSWPSFWSDWSLEATTTLGSGGWGAVTETPTTGLSYEVQQTISGTDPKFFRLTR